MDSLIDICVVNVSLIHQNLVNVNDFNCLYMLARRLNRNFIEVTFFINLVEFSTESCSTAIEVLILYTNMKKKKIESEF